jgi:hypothetical protein
MKMSPNKYGRYKSIIVLGCDHAGLQPHFQRLEDELNRTVNTIDDPRVVKFYLSEMLRSSIEWRNVYALPDARK